MLSNLEEIGKRIKKTREERALKQANLASSAKIDQTSLSRYENGKQEPNLETFARLAQALNVSADYLLFGSEKKEIFPNKEESYELWSEVVSDAIATLIENNVIEIVTCGGYEGIGLRLEKNSGILEFFDKILKLNDLRDAFSDEQYKRAREKLIQDYKSLIYYTDLRLINDGALFRKEDREQCDCIMEDILKRHK